MKLTPVTALSGMCIGLFAGCLYALLAPASAYPVPAVRLPPLSAPPPPPTAFAAPPPNAFAAIGDRPLFDAERKKYVPPPKPDEAKQAPPPPPNLSLVGVIIDSDKRLAMVKASDGMLASSIAVGANIGGWQVAAIEPDRIVLTAGTAQDEIRLDANKAPPQTAAQAMSPAGGTMPQQIPRQNGQQQNTP